MAIEGKKKLSSLEVKLKMKREKLTITIPEDNGKLPYQIPNSRVSYSPAADIARKNRLHNIL